MARFRLPFHRVIVSLLLIIRMIPVVALAIPLFAVFANLAAFLSMGVAKADSGASQASTVDASGTVHLRALDVPFSSFARITAVSRP